MAENFTANFMFICMP